MTAGEAHAAMRALPLADLATILAGRAPLVLAPHADDESLGCGGLLASCASAGLRPAVLVLTDGTGSHPRSKAYPAARLRDLREAEAREAAAILGVAPDRIGFVRLRDTAAPVAGAAFETAVAEIVGWLSTWECRAILAPWRHDPHCDHEAAHMMAVAVAARVPGLRHLAYPVWGWTLAPALELEGPAPAGFRLDVSGALERKRRAIGAHRSQHAGLIDDDDTAFRLAPDFVGRFTESFETYLTAP